MKKITFLFTFLFFAISTFAADYYVAGTSSLCGSNWSNNDAANKMELVNGIYTKVYSNVPAGSHEFKITNGTWDNSKGAGNVDASTSTPGYTGNDNISFVLIASTTITISYNESTDKITLKAEGLDKFGEFTISSYTLCGDFPCFGGDWTPANSDNDMTKGDNGIWTKTYENVNLEAKTYEYKVAANHNWGQGEFPTQGNGQYEIKEAGTYNLTFTYNTTKPELTCEATLVGEPAEKILYPVNETIYVTVHSQWTADNARFAAYFFGSKGDTWTDMTKVNDAIYSLTVPAGEWHGMIVCRMNPNNTENRWNNDGEENAPFWGAQTQDIKYEEDKNHYIINSEDPTWDGNKPSGHWTTYDSENDNPGSGNDDPEQTIITIPNGTKLYLAPGEWTSDNARFAAYFFGGEGELWLDMIDSNNDSIYEVTCQGDKAGVVFVRMNPEATENIWDNKWNQTDDLTYDGTNNLYTITGWGENGANSTGTWSLYSNEQGDNNNENDKPGENDKPNIDPNVEAYTLCGDSIIFSTHWDETNTNNDMTKNDNGIWVKEYKEITLPAGTYEYKVVANHTWGKEGQYPADDTNMTLYLPKTDTYNLTFTYNIETIELKCSYTSTTMVDVENVTIDQIYTIGGRIFANTDIQIYTITGHDVTTLNGNLNNGIYIVKTSNNTIKINIK